MLIVKNKKFKEILLNNKTKKIPENFKFDILKNIFDVFKDHRGISPNKIPYDKNAIPLLTTRNIKCGKIIQPTEFIDLANYKERSKRKQVENGDMIFTTEAPLGEVAICKNNNFALGQRMIALNSSNHNINYMMYFFQSMYMKKIINNHSTGSTVGGIKTSTFKKLSAFFPTKDQQEKIAKILSNQEQNIDNIKSLIEKLELRNQEMAERLLSGELRVRLDSNGEIEFYKNPDDNWKEELVNGYLHKDKMRVPKDWKIAKASSFVKLQKGCSVKAELFNYDGKGMQFLRTGDVWDEGASKKEPAFFDGEIDKKFIKKEDDYLFAFEGYNTKIGKGTIGLLTDSLEGIVSSHLYKVLNDESSKYYSLSLLKLNYIQNLILRQAVGTTVLSSTKSWKTLEYIFPKSKSESELINKVLSGNYKEIRELKKLLKSEKTRFEQMSEMLLSGEYVLED